MEGEQAYEQAYLLTETMQEGGLFHNEIQRDEEVQEMNTFQPNSQDQQSIDILLDTSMVDASHEETVAEEDDFKTMNVQPNSEGDRSETQLNLGAILATQLVLIHTTIGRHVDEAI